MLPVPYFLLSVFVKILSQIFSGSDLLYVSIRTGICIIHFLNFKSVYLYRRNVQFMSFFF